TARECVASDNTFKATTLRDANGINEIAGSEQRWSDNVTRFHVFGEITKLTDAFHRDTVLFFDVTEQRLGEALFFLIVETKLHGVVAVFAGLRLDLQYAVRSGEHNGDGDQRAIRIID